MLRLRLSARFAGSTTASGQDLLLPLLLLLLFLSLLLLLMLRGDLFGLVLLDSGVRLSRSFLRPRVVLFLPRHALLVVVRLVLPGELVVFVRLISTAGALTLVVKDVMVTVAVTNGVRA